MSNRTRLIASAAFLTAASFVAPVMAEDDLSANDRANLDRCLDAMLMGPEVKKVRVLGHEYNCKPISGFEVNDGSAKITGQLSHHLRWRPDDQIFYSMIVSQTGEVTDLDVRVERGGASQVIRKVVGKTADLKKIDITDDDWSDFDKAARELGHLIDGEWEGSAEFIVATLSARLAQSFADSFVNTNGTSPNPGYHGRQSYFVNRPGSDFRSSTLDEADPDLCERMCYDDRQCISWTYVRPRINGEDAKCWLKDEVADPVLSFRTVSGAVNGYIRMDR